MRIVSQMTYRKRSHPSHLVEVIRMPDDGADRVDPDFAVVGRPEWRERMGAKPGDFVVREPDGFLHVEDPDVFALIYEVAPSAWLESA